MQLSDRTKSILEYDKILAMLAALAPTEGARDAALSLSPSNDPDEVRARLRRTGDARRLLDDKGMPSFGSVRDPSDALGRAGKGATLTARALYRSIVS